MSGDQDAIHDALTLGDVSAAWLAAEAALAGLSLMLVVLFLILVLKLGGRC